MAGRKDAAEGAEGPRDLRSEIGRRKTESYLETTGDFAPVYQGEGEQGQEGLSRSERDMGFVTETMCTTQIQSIITRIEMVAQDLIQTASRDDVQRLKRSMWAFKSASRGVWAGVYILVENGYLFPPPSEIYIFSPKNSMIFAQDC